MRHVPQAEMLAAMKDRLRDLNNIKLLSPNDLSILSLRRDLRAKIAELEKRQNPAAEYEVRAMGPG